MVGTLTPPPGVRTTPSSPGFIDSEMRVLEDLGGVTALGGPGGPGSSEATRFGGADSTQLHGVAPASTSTAAARHGHGENTGPLLVGQAFGARYHVIRVLGIGGMGAVYHVWDAELGQAVALKVVRPEATDDPSIARELERRFKQELVLARQVTHKNVVRSHDLGEINGIKYITMPFLDGADVATLLKEQGKLPADTAMRIMRDVASGLVAAYEAGIVHRDLKPANIMVVGDHAVIMDFGIARAAGNLEPVAAGAGAGSPSLLRASAGATMVGTVLGTVEYMAPEQAKGQPVDQRADIYALGLILSDMLLGKRPGERVSSVEALKRRMEHAPPSVRTVDPSIPERLDRLIARCLEPDPAARFQTSAELVAELNRLDDHGAPLPIHRVVGIKVLAAAVLVFVVLLAGVWWFGARTVAPVQHEPVSVLIADFENTTGDTAFDRTLEPMLRLALEEAGFISAYSRSEISRSLGVRPPEQLTEAAAREIAIKQGLGIVLSGGIRQQGRNFVVSVKATQAVTGDVVSETNDRAARKDQVLGVAATLATSVREALGDEVSESAQRFAKETLSATSLDVVHEYAGGIEALSRSRFDEALGKFSKAVALDPKFGLAYAGMAITARNLDKQQDAERHAQEAIKYLDSMTERERYRTRGIFYFVTGDYQQCVKEYGDLVARYAADAAARNNLALCSTFLRDMPRALDEMRQVVKILPNRALYRENFALYASYSGAFAAGEEEARAMTAPGVFGLLSLAFAQVGQGQIPAARATYESIGKIDAQGASYMASGTADLALYEGRFAEAERLFSQGAAADLAAKEPDRAAAKLAAAGYAALSHGRNASAVAAADKALAQSQAAKIRFLAARVYAEAGATDKARALAAKLSSELQAEPQAYGKIVEGNIALQSGDARQAIKVLGEANGLLDTWIGHFDLGRAYLAAGAALQADSEFDRCLKRRGEALALFLDEEPTVGLLPIVYYYQGRVREALKNAGFAESYRTYLAIRGKSTDDPLLADVRRRAGS